MTRVFALLGHPVAHSMSPSIHRAAYVELELPHRYELLDVADEASFSRAVDALRRGELAGANVTVPWKRLALRLADRRDESAVRVGAANVLCRAADGAIVAHNTDVPALTEELGRYVTEPGSALVLGNGGAALAAVSAAQRVGARRVAVTARRWLSDVAVSEWANAEEFRRLGAETWPWPAETERFDPKFAAYCRSVQLVLQATSAGMHGGGAGETVARCVPWTELPPGAVAYDLVYNPPKTAFLRAAQSQGLSACHGLGMLVGQAALAIELWLGRRPSREPLYQAAEAELIESLATRPV